MTTLTPEQVASLRALSLADKSRPNYELKDPCSAIYNPTIIHALCADWEQLRVEQEDITVRAICADSMADEQRERAEKAEAEVERLKAQVREVKRNAFLDAEIARRLQGDM